jgi:hypothetical protein
MKKQLITVTICLLVVSTLSAQFQKIQRTVATPTTPVQTKQPVSHPVILNGAVAGNGGNFSNPSTTFTLPDGHRVTMTLQQNPQNLPNNFGGVVKETVLNSSRSSSPAFDCVTDVKTVSATSSSFMSIFYNQQAIQIYPGAIYSFSDFFNGNFRAFEQGRNPISISSDNLANTTGPVYKDVPVPTANNIRASIANIIQPFSTTTGSAGIQYRVFNTSNDADMSIKLSAGGGYAGFSASGGYNNTQSEKKFYLTIDAIKPMYTLISSSPANGYFSDKSIEAANKNLMVIKSVTYGTRILANLEITITKQSDEINFKASFGSDSGKGVSANFNAMFNYIKGTNSVTSTANAYVVGGPLNTTMFDKDKLQEQITELLTRCNYQTAQPIAYSFADMSGNILGVKSATDQFSVPDCVPKGSIYKLSGVTVQIQTGKDNKEQGSNASVYLSNSNNIIVFESTSNNTEFTNMNNIVLQSKGLADNYLVESAFASKGGFIDIFFDPKPIFLDYDQWNVNGASVTLTFTDLNGGSPKVVPLDFTTARALLQKGQQRLRLSFDKNFNAGGVTLAGL